MTDFFTHHFYAGARIEAQVGAVGEALEAQGLHQGKMIGASRSGYCEQHPDHDVFFNACIFIKERKRLKVTYRQIWWGDIDLTLSRSALIAAADASGVDLYVTREKYRWKGYKGQRDDEVVFIKAQKGRASVDPEREREAAFCTPGHCTTCCYDGDCSCYCHER